MPQSLQPKGRTLRSKLPAKQLGLRCQATATSNTRRKVEQASFQVQGPAEEHAAAAPCSCSSDTATLELVRPVSSSSSSQPLYELVDGQQKPRHSLPNGGHHTHSHHLEADVYLRLAQPLRVCSQLLDGTCHGAGDAHDAHSHSVHAAASHLAGVTASLGDVASTSGGAAATITLPPPLEPLTDHASTSSTPASDGGTGAASHHHHLSRPNHHHPSHQHHPHQLAAPPPRPTDIAASSSAPQAAASPATTPTSLSPQEERLLSHQGASTSAPSTATPTPPPAAPRSPAAAAAAAAAATSDQRLQARVEQARSWAAVQQVVAEQGNDLQAAEALAYLQLLGAIRPRQMPKTDATALVKRLVATAVASARELPAGQLVALLVAMARLRWQPLRGQAEAVKAALAPRLGGCTAMQVAAALSALRSLRAEPGGAWQAAALGVVGRQLAGLGANALGLVVFRIGRTNIRPPDAFFAAVAEAMSVRVAGGRGSPQALARCLHGMAAAGYRPAGAHLELWLGRCWPLLRSMDDYSLVLLAQALHRPLMRVTPQARPLLARLYHHAAAALPAFHPCCVAGLLHCTPSCPPPALPPLLSAASQHLAANLPAYTATPRALSHLAAVLAACARHSHRPPAPLLAAVAEHMASTAHLYPPPTLALLLSTAPFLPGWQPPDHWFPALESVVLRLQVPRSDAWLEAACGLAQAYAAAGRRPPADVAAHVVGAVLPDPRRPPGRWLPVARVAQLLWVVAVLRPAADARWVGALLRVARPKLAAASPAAVLQLLDALARLRGDQRRRRRRGQWQLRAEVSHNGNGAWERDGEAETVDETASWQLDSHADPLPPPQQQQRQRPLVVVAAQPAPATGPAAAVVEEEGGREEDEEWLRWEGEEAVLEGVTLAALAKLGEYGAEDCCRLLVDLGSLRHRPSGRWLALVTAHAAAGTGGGSGGGLDACPLWLLAATAAALARMGAGPQLDPAFGDALLRASQAQLAADARCCTARAAAQLLEGVAALRLRPGQRWYVTFLRAARARLRRLPEEDLPRVRAAAQAVGGEPFVQQLRLRGGAGGVPRGYEGAQQWQQQQQREWEWEEEGPRRVGKQQQQQQQECLQV